MKALFTLFLISSFYACNIEPSEKKWLKCRVLEKREYTKSRSLNPGDPLYMVSIKTLETEYTLEYVYSDEDKRWGETIETNTFKKVNKLRVKDFNKKDFNENRKESKEEKDSSPPQMVYLKVRVVRDFDEVGHEVVLASTGNIFSRKRSFRVNEADLADH